MINPDVEALIKTRNEDLWVYDKFIVAKTLGYICGPKGQEVPKPGKYIIRPVINFMGMGLGAEIVSLKKSTEHIPDGFFWCEVFKGNHISVDYYKKSQVLTVEGIRSESQGLSHWLVWKTIREKKKYPKILKKLKGKYKWVNVEYIGDKIIEIHLRKNPDFEGHTSDYVIPIWNHQKFIESIDQDRKGFYCD